MELKECKPGQAVLYNKLRSVRRKNDFILVPAVIKKIHRLKVTIQLTDNDLPEFKQVYPENLKLRRANEHI